MSHNNVTPLEVPTQLLRMPLIKNKEILEKKCKELNNIQLL